MFVPQSVDINSFGLCLFGFHLTFDIIMMMICFCNFIVNNNI